MSIPIVLLNMAQMEPSWVCASPLWKPNHFQARFEGDGTFVCASNRTFGSQRPGEPKSTRTVLGTFESVPVAFLDSQGVFWRGFWNEEHAFLASRSTVRPAPWGEFAYTPPVGGEYCWQDYDTIVPGKTLLQIDHNANGTPDETLHGRLIEPIYCGPHYTITKHVPTLHDEPIRTGMPIAFRYKHQETGTYRLWTRPAAIPVPGGLDLVTAEGDFPVLTHIRGGALPPQPLVRDSPDDKWEDVRARRLDDGGYLVLLTRYASKASAFILDSQGAPTHAWKLTGLPRGTYVNDAFYQSGKLCFALSSPPSATSRAGSKQGWTCVTTDAKPLTQEPVDPAEIELIDRTDAHRSAEPTCAEHLEGMHTDQQH